MKRAFICDTPFQLFNTLNFVINNPKENDDLYLVNQFKGAEKILEQLKCEKIFKNIFKVTYDVREQKDLDLIWYIKRMYHYLCPKKTILRNVENNRIHIFYKNYQEIYVSIVTYFVICMLRENPKAKLIMIEDGTGSYSGNLIDSCVGWKHRLFAQIFHCGVNVARPNKLLVNNVRMCKSTMTNVIEPLPAITEHTLEKIEKVFGKGKELENKPVIWLTQPDDGYSQRNNVNCKIAAILKNQKENITVRMHPRDKGVQTYKEFDYDKTGKMWELYVATIDMDKKILISSYSSAQFTPKIIFDKEPILIFLFKLYDDGLIEKNQNNIEQMVLDLKEEYTHKERIIIVKGFDTLEIELLNALKLIKDK